MGNLCAIYQQSIFNTPLGKFFRSPFFGVIETLSTTGLLTRDTFNTIANHQDLLVLTDVLDRLSSEGLLTDDAAAQATFNAIIAGHQAPSGVANALNPLHSVGEPVGLDDAFGRTAEQGTSVPVVAHTTTIIPQSFFGAVRPPVNTTPEVDEMQFTGPRS